MVAKTALNNVFDGLGCVNVSKLKWKDFSVLQKVAIVAALIPVVGGFFALLTAFSLKRGNDEQAVFDQKLALFDKDLYAEHGISQIFFGWICAAKAIVDLSVNSLQKPVLGATEIFQ